MTFFPADYGKGIGHFISKIIYTSPEVAIREMIANAKDQYLDETTKNHEGYRKIEIHVDQLHKIIKCIDYATGILDVRDFKRFFSDGKPSKKVGNAVSTIEDPIAGMTGVYHVGKASFIKMSSRTEGIIVKFYSNNGKEGNVLSMMLQNGELGWDDDFRYEKEHAWHARQDVGLTVEIFDVVDELLKTHRIERLISDCFGILIKRGLQIYVVYDTHDGNQPLYNKVNAPDDLDTKGEEKRTPELLLSTGRYITHNLKENLRPRYENIDVYASDYVKIKSIHVDYCVEGWINCDSFELNGARDGFQTGEGSKYTEGMRLFLAWLPSRFKRQHRESNMTGQEDMNKYLQKILTSASQIFQLDPFTMCGIKDDNSCVTGELNADKDNKGQWQRKENVTIVPGKGDPDNPIKTIGPGTKGPGPGPGGPGTGGPGYEEGGTHTIVEKIKDNAKKRGPIKPNIIFDFADLTDEEPMSKMSDVTKVVLNTSIHGVRQIMIMPRARAMPIVGSLAVDAIVEFITKGTEINIHEYRKKCSALYSASLSLLGGS